MICSVRWKGPNECHSLVYTYEPIIKFKRESGEYSKIQRNLKSKINQKCDQWISTSMDPINHSRVFLETVLYTRYEYSKFEGKSSSCSYKSMMRAMMRDFVILKRFYDKDWFKEEKEEENVVLLRAHFNLYIWLRYMCANALTEFKQNAEFISRKLIICA